MKYRKAPTQFHHVLHYMALAILILSVRITEGGTNNCPNRLDILVAVDTASSQSAISLDQMKSEVKAIASQFTVGQDKVRLALIDISMSKDTKVIVNFNEVNSISDFNTAVDTLKLSPGVADVSGGMKLARDSVLSTARSDASKILILVKDSRSRYGDVSSASVLPRMTKAAGMKAVGSVIHVVGIGGHWNREELRAVFGNDYILFGSIKAALAYTRSGNNAQCTPRSPPVLPRLAATRRVRCSDWTRSVYGVCYESRRHVIRTSLYPVMLPNGTVKCQKLLSRHIGYCSKPESCRKRDRHVGPCIDGKVKIDSTWWEFFKIRQTCIGWRDTASVKCEDAHKCDGQVADVYFLLDKSGSIGGNFPQVKQATKTIIESLTIGPSNVRVGVLRFASKPAVTVDIELGSINSTSDLLSAVDRIPNEASGDKRYTHEALKTARKAFASDLGRKSVDKFVVVITDGESTLTDEMFMETAALKNRNVTIYAVGVGNVKISELETMTAPESSTNMFILKKSTDLQQWAQNFSKNSCILLSAPTHKLCEIYVDARSISSCTAGKKLVTETKYEYNAAKKCMKTIRTSIRYDCKRTCVNPMDGDHYVSKESWKALCHTFYCNYGTVIDDTSECLAADGSCKPIGSPAFKCVDEKGRTRNNCQCLKEGHYGGAAVLFDK